MTEQLLKRYYFERANNIYSITKYETADGVKYRLQQSKKFSDGEVLTADGLFGDLEYVYQLIIESESEVI